MYNSRSSGQGKWKEYIDFCWDGIPSLVLFGEEHVIEDWEILKGRI